MKPSVNLKISGPRPPALRAPLRHCLAALFLFCPALGFAAPPRTVGIDAGAGVPELAFVRGQAMVSQQWQVGLGWGLLTSLYPIKNIVLPSQNITLGNSGTFSVTPEIAPSLTTFSPFVRFYPGESNFYLQFAFNLLVANATVTALLQATTPIIATAFVSGHARVIQAIPVISVGDVWTSKIYFASLTIGVGYYLPPWTNFSFDGGFPAGVGDSASNQAAIDSISSSVQSKVTDESNQLRKVLPFVPCISVSVGVML